jgi:hypothetical protein
MELRKADVKIKLNNISKIELLKSKKMAGTILMLISVRSSEVFVERKKHLQVIMLF